MKHAILLFAYKNPDQICTLIEYFKSDCYIFIHLDKKSHFTDEELNKLTSYSHVKAIYRKYPIYWGGYNILKSEIFMFEQALRNCDADYFHLISGQDYPVKPFASFLKHFETFKDKEFVEYKNLPSHSWERGTYSRYQYFYFYDQIHHRNSKESKWIKKLVYWQKRLGIKRSIPDHFDHLYGGSAWLSITRECTTYLVEYTRKHPAFYRRLNYTFAPEETYLPTILLNSSFREKIINNNYRYIRWKSENGNLPANLSEMHFGKLAVTDALFARKFDSPWCEKLIPLIDRYLLQDSPAVISKTGSWQHPGLSGHHFDRSLCKALEQVCKLTHIESAVDLGCGPGYYVNALRKKGIPIMGYDGNPHAEQISTLILHDKVPCETVDLTDDLSGNEPFELVLCLDVCSYIPEEYEERLIRNLVDNSERYIILSWATPALEREGYINKHPNEYVIQKFKDFGFTEDFLAKNYLREQTTLPWFKESLFVFQRSV